MTSLNAQLFRGDRVRLTAVRPDTDAETEARWSRDSEFWRLAYPHPAFPLTVRVVRQEMLEEAGSRDHVFAMRRLSDDRFIGQIGLWAINRSHAEAWVGIYIGERDCWGQGYGTDAMRVVLRYAFTELNLYRVSLAALAENLRAVRSYQKAGFAVEGRVRRAARYEGAFFDEVYMGILQDEWAARAEGES